MVRYGIAGPMGPKQSIQGIRTAPVQFLDCGITEKWRLGSQTGWGDDGAWLLGSGVFRREAVCGVVYG